MKHEDILQHLRQGHKSSGAYRVPDGYFDDFTQRMMAQLPQQPRRQRTLWRYAAAAVLCIALGATSYLYREHKTQQATAELHGEDYTQEVLDYTMLRNSEIEYYLTEAE